jgi:hypothetical protein
MYIGAIPVRGEACALAQSISGPPPRAVRTAMRAKVGVAARQSQSAAKPAANLRLFPTAGFKPVGREGMAMSDMLIAQRLRVFRSSERPAFTRGH